MESSIGIKSQLHCILVVETQFKDLILDCVAPLLKSKAGNNYMLADG